MVDSLTESKELIAFIDGASKGNPGESSYAFILGNEEGTIIMETAARIGIATNNEAEYRALLAVLDQVLERGGKKLRVFSDSQLLVKQINHLYQVKSSRLLPLYQEAQRKIHKLGHFEIFHIPREENQKADRLASEILTQKLSFKIGRK
ncbi:MAG TPA: ribonuclease HI family protein [Candidatus Atribacteria bacterium]|uniref:ribonuclease HI family protein n=1 Tax=Candidatus Sordicultor fermentans TaxID=1953203 RepID=UPI0016A89B0C|nr:ribonuclease HI family protein [Atribacterota bacterium]NLY05284.1 ribonuclease HI family protein [Candidatus Atribacteria bacterium]MDI9608553.1 ribonuclease HI family protein [Atribacterota bacterium]HOA99871.1 ribonuclease HI family protein [Candidatus Atribacteria bacterium]HOQ50628.1 ribonuclease HI family protein [Candidatus Atribacteria bacterium]